MDPVALMITAASAGDVAALAAHLADGVDVNAVSQMAHANALTEAAKAGAVDTVRMLLEQPSIDVNIEDLTLGRTPLYWACSKGDAEHADVALLLLDHPKISAMTGRVNGCRFAVSNSSALEAARSGCVTLGESWTRILKRVRELEAGE